MPTFIIKEFNDAVACLKELNSFVGHEIQITHYGFYLQYAMFDRIPIYQGVFLGIDEVSLDYKILVSNGSTAINNIFFKRKEYKPSHYAYTKIEVW